MNIFSPYAVPINKTVVGIDGSIQKLAYSPFSPYALTATSEFIRTPNGLDIVTQFSPVPSMLKIDTGMHDNWYAQKETTRYLWYRILDHWLYKDELSDILKYMKIVGDKVVPVKTKAEANANKQIQETPETIQKKADYIEENFFGLNEMRHILMKIIDELNYKWYNLADNEKLVVSVTKIYLSGKFKDMLIEEKEEKEGKEEKKKKKKK